MLRVDTASYRNRRLDVRMRLIALECKVFVDEAEKVGDGGIEMDDRQFARNAGQLFACLIDVVQIEMGIAEGMHEITGLQARGLSYHHGEQGVRRDIERDAEENIGRALVELARQPTPAGPPRATDMKLEQAVTGRQGHFVQFANIPR